MNLDINILNRQLAEINAQASMHELLALSLHRQADIIKQQIDQLQPPKKNTRKGAKQKQILSEKNKFMSHMMVKISDKKIAA